MKLARLSVVFALVGVSAVSGFGQTREWHQEAGWRWAELKVPQGGKTGFKLLTPDETGIQFTNTLDLHAGEANRVLFNGSGVALGDYNNDGLPDIFLCSLNGHNALYKNLGGFKFQDVTQQSGIICSNQFCRGAVFADVNGDGLLDLLLATTGSGVLCFVNDGREHFTNVTSEAGLDTWHGSVTLALADVDGNGTLDLYVANNRTDDIRDRGEVNLQMVNGKLTVPPNLKERLVVINGKVLEYGEADQLYLNDGHGRFKLVSWTGGAFLDEDGHNLPSPPLDWGLTATFRDINGDGAPDLYVCNDYWTPDRIWINDGHGHFRAAPKLAFRETSASSMSVDFADLTRSGKLDLLVVDMLSRELRLRKRQMFAQSPMASRQGAIDNRPQMMRNTLFFNRGDDTFAEIANFAGLAASEWCWSPLFLDVDLDGFEDVLIPAGHTKDVQDLDAEEQMRARSGMRSQISKIADPQARREAFIEGKIENARLYPALNMPIVAFRNLGGYHFEETTAAWGTDTPGVHHAIAAADLEGDGDLDLIVNNLGTAAGIYRNETSAPRVAVRLKGIAPNTQGIGSKIKLLGATVPMQSQEVISGGRYMAGSDTLAVFACGQVVDGMKIEVKWGNGKRTEVGSVRANCIVEIDELGAHDAVDSPKPPLSEPIFADISSALGHTHHENDFNDFERQPLLPRKLSQAGPGLAWADLDGDGWEDLIIGTGKGGQMAVYRNDHKGGLERLIGAPFDQTLSMDQSGIVVLQEARGASILAGLANYEDGAPKQSVVQQFDFETKKVSEFAETKDSSFGPLALCDMDGDGNLELFVGGRVVPGRYPESANSRIFRRQDTQWQLDNSNSRVLEKVGLVSGAVWSDLDGDGYAELILACEWGSLRIFHNDHGRLAEWDAPLVETTSSPDSPLSKTNARLSNLSGWWNGVTTCDLDGTGRLAIIALNWGLNTPYHATPEHPALLYFGDFAERGTIDLIEAENDPLLKITAPLRMRDRVAIALPDLPSRFKTHKSYSEAPIAEVLGPQRSAAHELKATCLASMIFLNRGLGFETRLLPAEAQYAPAFGAVVADFDGDGYEDLFISQNFFANQPEIPRYDAGRGLLLRGDGTGNLMPVPGQESGLKIYGEQRGAAAADFDRDGRVDLVVSQNGAATRLFRNIAAKPGLRVRLAGPPGNPVGIGAQIRLLFPDRAGPIRELHAGSGYWSQDGAVAVLGTPTFPSAVWVRWPGGKITTNAIPPGATEVIAPFAPKQ